MSITAPPAPPVENAEWHRLSRRMLLIHPVTEIGRALPALAGLFIAGSSHGSPWPGLIGTAVVAALSISRWFTTRLRITPQQVQLRHGLLRRKTIATARDRIRTVDVTAHLLHRLLGLARVVVGTGSNDRRGGGRLVLDGLTLDAATRLRDDLLHRVVAEDSTIGHPAADEPSAAEDVVLARLDTRWIRYAPFTLSGVVTGLVIWGFYWRVAGEGGVDLAKVGPLRTVVQALRDMPTGQRITVVTLGLVIFVAVTSTIGYVLAFWNFRLLRHAGGTLQVTRGLITSRATSIERRRLVGATISEPLPLRAVGAARVVAVATGLRTGRGAERGGEVLLPPAPLPVSLALVQRVLDGSTAVTAPLLAHGPAARRRRLMRGVLPGALLSVVLAVVWALGGPAWLVVIGLGLMVIGLALGIDRAAALGHGRAGGYLITRGGSLVRRRSVLDEQAIIGWNLRSTFFQRRLGLASLEATTAAGRQGYHVTDVPAGEALAMVESISPDLLRPFRTAPPATSR